MVDPTWYGTLPSARFFFLTKCLCFHSIKKFRIIFQVLEEDQLKNTRHSKLLSRMLGIRKSKG